MQNMKRFIRVFILLAAVLAAFVLLFVGRYYAELSRTSARQQSEPTVCSLTMNTGAGCVGQESIRAAKSSGEHSFASFAKENAVYLIIAPMALCTIAAILFGIVIKRELEQAVEKAALSEQLAMEQVQFRDALTRDAVYVIRSDITEGMIVEDLAVRSEKRWKNSTGVRFPVPYDEWCVKLIERFKVSFLDDDARRYATCKGVTQAYEQGGVSEHFDIFIGTHDIYARLLYLLYEDPHSGHLMCLCICSDITAQHKAQLATQKKLNEQSNYLRVLSNSYFVTAHFDLVNDKRYIINAGNYSEKYVRDTDVGIKEALDLWARNDLTPEDLQANKDFWDIDSIKRRLRRADTITREIKTLTNGWVSLQIVALKRDENGDVTDVTWLTRKIDEQKQREIEMARALEAAFEEANRANAAKTVFLSSMSHDIRTPMNAIIGMADIAMRHRDDPAKLEDSLKRIQSSGEQLLLLVNDILDISAIESGKLHIRPTVHNVLEDFDQFKAIFWPQLEVGAQQSEFIIHDIIKPWVLADEVRISQIFNNLLSNAVKYTPDGGTVRFEVYQEQDPDGRLMTVGVVSDNGIGISEEYMDYMWDSFSRAADTRVNSQQGSGLGLAIVKKLVGLMGGVIEVESKLNRGSVFRVRLPLEPVEQSDYAVKNEDDGSGRLDARVIIAEDNDVNWEIAAELLNMRGVTVVRAENGEVCLRLFDRAPAGTYDAILMDMKMPVMDGVETARVIRASSHPDAAIIPIIAITANTFSEDVARCREAGMNDYLTKPFDVDKVIAALRRCIRKNKNE